MTELPSTVRVGAYTFSIELDENRVNSQRVKENDSHLVGHIDLHAQKISICPKQGPDALADTVLHEMLHACFMVSGAPGSSEKEEKIVSILTPILLDTLRRNPDLVDYLVGNDSKTTRGSKSTRKT